MAPGVANTYTPLRVDVLQHAVQVWRFGPGGISQHSTLSQCNMRCLETPSQNIIKQTPRVIAHCRLIPVVRLWQ